MTCSAGVSLGCGHGPLAGGIGGAIAGGILASVAHAVVGALAWVLSGTADWWVRIPSPDLASEPAVAALQHWLLPITAAVAVVSMLIAAAKMALTRRASPLMDVGSGLAVIAVTSAVGILLPTLLLRAGDAWSNWVLNASTGGQFATRLIQILNPAGAGPVIAIIFGLFAIAVSVIQAVLMLFRQGALLVLAGILPLAAAGTMSSGTRPWFRRITGWMLALIFYKPAAAAVYATAFTFIGRGRDPRTQLAGYAMILLAIVALPALMRFFTWTAGAVAQPAGGGGVLSTMLSGAVAVGAVRGSAGGAGGSSAAAQARLTSAQLGASDTARSHPVPGPAQPSTAPPSPSGASAAMPAFAKAGAAAGGPVGAAAGAGGTGIAAAARSAAAAAQPPTGGEQ